MKWVEVAAKDMREKGSWCRKLCLSNQPVSSQLCKGLSCFKEGGGGRGSKCHSCFWEERNSFLFSFWIEINWVAVHPSGKVNRCQ